MSLSTYRVGAAVAAAGDGPDGGRTYRCGDETTLHVFPSAGGRASGATVAGWTVDDLESVVGELTRNGVSFERYDEPPIATDERGIAVVGGSKGAWFMDPDGNVLGLIEE